MGRIFQTNLQESLEQVYGEHVGKMAGIAGSNWFDCSGCAVEQSRGDVEAMMETTAAAVLVNVQSNVKGEVA